MATHTYTCINNSNNKLCIFFKYIVVSMWGLEFWVYVQQDNCFELNILC